MPRFAAAIIVALLWTQVSLQQPAQPPRDGALITPGQSPSQLAREGHDFYKAQRWAEAAAKYEAALAAEPDLRDIRFYLGNCYDNLYSPKRRGQPDNDDYLRKAVENYRAAAEHQIDPKIRRLALEYLVAAYGPEKLNDPAMAEPVLQRMVATDPTDTAGYFALAKLYEDAGRYEDAERMLARACGAKPSDPAVYRQLAGFYNRTGDFDRTMDALHRAADLEPSKAEPQQLVATYYWEKAYKDHRLTGAQRATYVRRGIEATDRALAIDPDYVDALAFKNLLLRLLANDETDASRRAELYAEADALRNRAMELRGRGGAPGIPVTVTPPGGVPPPSPPPPQAPVRVGGSIKAPARLGYVAPVYPDEAQRANVQGVVIIDATIDKDGNVSDVRILRSIPLLDRAAVDAVRQWKYEPTLLNGMPVPVIMTVTVRFAP